MLPDPPNPSPDPSPDRPPAGQEVKTVFTIGEPERYASGMVIFASLALATAALAVPWSGSSRNLSRRRARRKRR